MFFCFLIVIENFQMLLFTHEIFLCQDKQNECLVDERDEHGLVNVFATSSLYETTISSVNIYTHIDESFRRSALASVAYSALRCKGTTFLWIVAQKVLVIHAFL